MPNQIYYKKYVNAVLTKRAQPDSLERCATAVHKLTYLDVFTLAIRCFAFHEKWQLSWFKLANKDAFVGVCRFRVRNTRYGATVELLQSFPFDTREFILGHHRSGLRVTRILLAHHLLQRTHVHHLIALFVHFPESQRFRRVFFIGYASVARYIHFVVTHVASFRWWCKHDSCLIIVLRTLIYFYIIKTNHTGQSNIACE